MFCNFCALHRICSMEDPHHSEHTSDHLAVVYDDRVHRIVFRLQTDVILFFIETFYCSRVINQRNHDLSVIGFLTTLHKNLVAIQNPGIYHRIAADIQHKARLTGRHGFCRNWKIAFDIFFGKDWLSGCNIADNRKARHLCANSLKAVVCDLNRARLSRVPADISVLLQRLQMRMNGRRGF